MNLVLWSPEPFNTDGPPTASLWATLNAGKKSQIPASANDDIDGRQRVLLGVVLAGLIVWLIRFGDRFDS